jgi:hypothetical protein
MEPQLPCRTHVTSGMEAARNTQIGDRVSFRISDVFLPEPSEVLANLTAEVEAHGVVEGFSDSGDNPRAYAVIRITARQSVLLPVGAVHPLRDG